MKEDTKFIQLATTGGEDPDVYALDEEGSVWCYHRADTYAHTPAYWYRLSGDRKIDGELIKESSLEECRKDDELEKAQVSRACCCIKGRE